MKPKSESHSNSFKLSASFGIAQTKGRPIKSVWSLHRHFNRLEQFGNLGLVSGG